MMLLEDLLRHLRSLGWSVGVHNDYRLEGESHTFWLFTHSSGRFVKGEGPTDFEAVTSVVHQVEDGWREHDRHVLLERTRALLKDLERTIVPDMNAARLQLLSDIEKELAP